MVRILRWIMIGLAAAVFAGWGALWLHQAGLGQAIRSAAGIDTPEGPPPGGAQVGGPFSLIDQTGQPVTDATWRGSWMLVYFGYTTCPDLCPTELQTIAAALDALGNQAPRVVPIFITIDPDRDTPGRLADYVKLFDDRLVGLTGTPAQIEAVARAYRVYYAKVTRTDSATYLMDHSSFLYLVGPDGRLRARFRSGATAEELAKAIRSRLPAAG